MPKTKTKTILVNVTRTRIKKGSRCDSKRCPVALALVPHLRPRVLFDVKIHDLEFFSRPRNRFFQPERALVVPLPKGVQQFIERYDARKKCRPFKFTLDIPLRYVRKSS